MHPNATIHNVEQGSDEWHACRNGLLTASEVKLILTPTLKTANNEKTRQHVYEIAAQRISGYTEPTYIGDAMLRGHADEVKARDLYSDRIAPVDEVGFITRDVGGFVLGYSPDGAGVFGGFGIECKSRVQKYQIQTITSDEVPDEHMLQLQAGLLVTGWDYIDYISYSGGLPMWTVRTKPVAEYQDAIMAAGLAFEKQVNDVIAKYHDKLSARDVIETERDVYAQEVNVYAE